MKRSNLNFAHLCAGALLTGITLISASCTVLNAQQHTASGKLSPADSFAKAATEYYAVSEGYGPQADNTLLYTWIAKDGRHVVCPYQLDSEEAAHCPNWREADQIFGLEGRDSQEWNEVARKTPEGPHVVVFNASVSEFPAAGGTLVVDFVRNDTAFVSAL